jgi:predicted acetyltransferase
LEKLELFKPTMEFADDIMKFRQELLNINCKFAGCGNLKNCLTADEWLKEINIFENEKTCPEGRVTSNRYIAVRLSDKKIVGIIDFRHHINHPILSVWGGHIGFTIRPDERLKGYAKEMLKLNLINCKNHGLDKVLITCDFDNIASEKTIIANGGIFEKIVKVDDRNMKRFWINL